MIQEFNKDFVFAYNKTKNIAFNMSDDDRNMYLTNKKTDKFELTEEYGKRKIIYILNHIMNISGSPVFHIDGEIEVIN